MCRIYFISLWTSENDRLLLYAKYEIRPKSSRRTYLFIIFYWTKKADLAVLGKDTHLFVSLHFHSLLAWIQTTELLINNTYTIQTSNFIFYFVQVKDLNILFACLDGISSQINLSQQNIWANWDYFKFWFCVQANAFCMFLYNYICTNVLSLVFMHRESQATIGITCDSQM